MGRGRSSTNYKDAEKQLLLRAVSAIKPRRAGCWHRVAAHYNAQRGDADGARVVERDAHSLKRKFKTMAAAAARGPRHGEFEDPYNARAKELMERIRARADKGEQGGEQEEEDEDESVQDEAEEDEGEHPQQPQPSAAYGHDNGNGDVARAPSPSTAVQFPSRIPSLAPLLPGPPPPPIAPRAPPARTTNPVPASAPRFVGGLATASDGFVNSDLAQLLLVIREENAQREAARRVEREEAIAREQRWRDEALEMRRQEREEAAAREERFRHEMAEQRRCDREEAAARHEQMMVILATLLKPSGSAEGGARNA